MLPLLSLVAAGTLTAVAVVRAKRRSAAGRAQGGRGLPLGTFQVVGQKMVAETEQILATEEVSLDNRFGNQPLVSDHEFCRSATVSIETDWSGHWDGLTSANLLTALKAELQCRLARKLGVEAGTQISRQIRLKFTVAPGKKVLYRVVWKQTAQRGLFEVGVGGQVCTVPYLITFGLAHAVQSVDLADKTP
ncbi:MAG: hypothetical protein HQL87_02930 [Magnetococcales bacterium]|nr:hypothetical protein [Magnetococcales bacterium]